MIDELVLEKSIAVASNAAKKAEEFKQETYFAVLFTSLLSQGAVSVPNRTQSQVPSERNGSASKPFSAAELFASKTWNTEIEKVALAGYFLERYSGSTAFTIAEIRDLLISAKVSPPANVNLAILKAIQKGWMMEVPSENEKRKTWALTQTGQSKIDELTKPGIAS